MSVLFYFWKLVMWPTSQQPIAWSLTQNHHDPVLHKVFSHSFLSDFLATMCSLPYLAMHTDYVDTTSSLSITVYIMFILFSSDFWLCLHQLPYWAMCTDHVNNASTLSKESTSCLFFFSQFLSDFFMIFALITILGNVHRPYKQHTNIVHNGLHHASPFFLFVFQCSGYICITYHIGKCAQTI